MSETTDTWTRRTDTSSGKSSKRNGRVSKFCNE
jgi:hypothetical protein